MNEKRKQEISSIIQLITSNIDANKAKVAASWLVDYGEDAEELLLVELQNPSNQRLDFVIEALGQLKSKKAVEPLLKLMAARTSNHTASEIASALIAIGDEKVIEAIIKLLIDHNVVEYPHNNKLRAAARVLKHFKAPDNLQKLTSLFELEQKFEIQLMIASILANWGYSKALDYLLEQYKLSNQRTSFIVSIALQTIGEPALPIFINLLNDDDILVVCQVLGIFNSWTREKFIPELAEPVINFFYHSNSRVREIAVTIAGQMRDKKAIQPLIEALEDNKLEVVQAAIISLGQIKDFQALKSLQNFPRGVDVFLDLALDWALSRFGIEPKSEKFSPNVLEILLASKWSSLRRVDITNHLNLLQDNNYRVTPLIFDLLKNLGGLKFEFSDEAGKTHLLDFSFQSLKKIIPNLKNSLIIKYATTQTNSFLCPVGCYISDGYRYPILLDLEGMFYLEIQEAFFLKGSSWQQLLNHFINVEFGIVLASIE